MFEPSPAFLQAFLFIYTFYHVTNATVQYLFYHRGRKSPETWRAQPEKPRVDSSSDSPRFIPWVPIFEPLFGIRPPGAEPYPYGWLICTVNTLIASLFAGLVAEAAARGLTKLYFDPVSEVSWLFILGEFLLITLHESVVEYYWHRMMHLPFFYRRFHKLHHFNKAPVPFADMLINPLEAIGYYCILYSPPFLYRCHWLSFFAYMGLMGLCGVIDHCGVKTLKVKAFGLTLYDSADHDLHHEKFNPNLGFPFIFMDMLHGTRRTKEDYLKPKKTTGKAEEQQGAAPDSSSRNKEKKSKDVKGEKDEKELPSVVSYSPPRSTSSRARSSNSRKRSSSGVRRR